MASAKELPTNPDKGDILLAGLVLTPGEGGASYGLPEGWAPLTEALVVLEGTRHQTSTDSRGLFIFTEAPEGEVTVVISKPGFQTVKRRAVVDKSRIGDPPTLRVEMLKLGSTVIDKVLSSSGTLYATFCPRTVTRAGDDGDFTNLLAVLATNADPLEVALVRPPTENLSPAMSELFPTVEYPCSVMIRPSEAPSRTTYHEMASVPVWPCFDQTGRYLYVSTVYQHRIEVYDVTRGNEPVANIPLRNAFISSLIPSRDGRFIYATQMGAEMGILLVDTKTHQQVGFFQFPDKLMIPNSLATSPDGKSLYVTLTNAVNPGAAGVLLELDSATGEVVSSLEVGGTPTDVLITPDGTTALTVNQGNSNISVVDLKTRTVLRSLPAEVTPTKAVLSSDGTQVWVTNKGSGTVSVLEIASGRILHRIKVGRGPVDIVLGKSGEEAFISNYLDGTISVLDVKEGRVKQTTPPAPRSNPLGLTIRP